MTAPADIRLATLQDLPSICALAQDLNLLHHAAWPTLFAPAADPSADEAHWRESIEAPGRAAFIAAQSGVATGFVTVALADESHSLLQPVRFVRVLSVCVAAASRGQGVGSALMAQAEAWARGRGAAEMRLVVWAFNESAIRLYHELGYSIRSHSMGKPLHASSPGRRPPP